MAVHMAVHIRKSILFCSCLLEPFNFGDVQHETLSLSSSYKKGLDHVLHVPASAGFKGVHESKGRLKSNLLRFPHDDHHDLRRDDFVAVKKGTMKQKQAKMTESLLHES